MDGSPVGFASLEGTSGSTCSTSIRRRGQGVGSMLVDALEKLAAARGARAADGRGERQRAGFLQAARVRAAARNTVPLGDEWLANTTMEKPLAAKERTWNKPDTSFPLPAPPHRDVGDRDPGRLAWC